MLEIAGGILLAVAALAVIIFLVIPILSLFGEIGCLPALFQIILVIAFMIWGFPLIEDFFESLNLDG